MLLFFCVFYLILMPFISIICLLSYFISSYLFTVCIFFLFSGHLLFSIAEVFFFCVVIERTIRSAMKRIKATYYGVRRTCSTVTSLVVDYESVQV
jgi:hypothetical protein